MTRIRKRDALCALTKARLLDLANEFEVEISSRSLKKNVVDALAHSRSSPYERLLGTLKRSELRDICRSCSLDYRAQKKSILIQRILGKEARNAVAPPERVEQKTRRRGTIRQAQQAPSRALPSGKREKRLPQRRRVPAGGPATINGIVYQLLWSLLRASRLQIESIHRDRTNEEIVSTTLILEPRGGGGDLVLKTPTRQVVEQIKARADGGPWSLRQIVEEVLPDLYVACPDAEEVNSDFRFVTEGTMGAWEDVYEFFQSLRRRKFPKGGPSAALDDTVDVPFVRTASLSKFWNLDSYTELALFGRIVAEIRKRRSVSEHENLKTTQRRVWALLSNFHFVPCQFASEVLAEINSHLAALVESLDDLDNKRDAMALGLANRAIEGDAEIDTNSFFREFGLDARPLNDWSSLRGNARRYVEAFLRRSGYDRDLDVRLATVADEVADWNPMKPLLVISGNSGQGKSWAAAAIAMTVLPCRELVVLVESSGDADSTLRRAGDVIWNEIAGREDGKALSSVAKRFRRALGSNLGQWLTLIIDGVLPRDETLRLARQPWDDWGIRAAITCIPGVAEAIQRESRGRCSTIAVRDFTVPQLQKYLACCLGEDWPKIPEYMRRPLRNPLLASLYRELATEPSWQPETEYHVFDAYWGRLAQDGLDTVLLRRLARSLLEGATYPFSDEQIAASNLDGFSLQRIITTGWIRQSPTLTPPRFEFAHDRLMNWAVAETLFEDYRSGALSEEEFNDTLARGLNGELRIQERRLDYLAMDALWLVARDASLRKRAAALLARLEGDQPHSPRTDALYKELVPTIGPSIVPALISRLRSVVKDQFLCRLVAEAISGADPSGIERISDEFLSDSDALVRRTAALLLQKHPTPEVLDRLWNLHVEASADSSAFLYSHETSDILLYQDCFRALRECSRLKPSWLVEVIGRIEEEPCPAHDLAYLVGNIRTEEGSRVWRTSKKTLFQCVARANERSLARCVEAFGDSEEIGWLLKRVSREGLVGVSVMSALVRTAPDLAIDHLHEVPLSELVSAASWFLTRLFAARRDNLRKKILQMMSSSDNPWTLAHIYHDRQHMMDEATLDYLLDDLETRLADTLRDPEWSPESISLYRPLEIVAGVNTFGLLRRIRARQGAALESLLCDFVVRIGPQHGEWRDSWPRTEAIAVLYRINGDGFTRIVNTFLAADSGRGRLEAIRLAPKRPDSDTINQLTEALGRKETWDGAPIEQSEAARALMDCQEWLPVSRFVKQHGMQVLLDIDDLLEVGDRPADLAGEMRQHIQSREGTPAPGTLLALGFLGDQSDGSTIRQVLEDSEKGSELAHSCVIALRLARDQEEESVPLLLRELEVEKHCLDATNALIVNRSREALEGLRSHYEGQFDPTIAINLITGLPDRSAVVSEIRDAATVTLQQGRPSMIAINLKEVLVAIGDASVSTDLLAPPVIREHLRTAAFEEEGGHWVVGSKAAAIWCLSQFDHEASFLAARFALRNPNARDRELYPHLLAELAEKRAATLLMDQLSVETAENVVSAIAASLATIATDQTILAELKSQSPPERRAACMVAGWAGPSTEIDHALRKAVSDFDGKVARAAAEALDRLSIREEAVRLAEELVSETDANSRWLLWDCLLLLADPGDDLLSLNRSGRPLGSVLSALQRKRGSEVLKRRRRK